MIENADFAPPSDPWVLFREWFALAEKNEPSDPNAMALATVGEGGMPSVRIVLMKGCDPKGFVFFTNRNSRKGGQLGGHPKAALCFHWKSLRRQVRAEGLVSEVSREESEAYFATRHRGSQIGAWVSQQSEALDDRATLERQVEEYKKKFAGRDVPCPPNWGGYLLSPVLIEFWQERLYRLHDRIVYRRTGENSPWEHGRVYP